MNITLTDEDRTRLLSWVNGMAENLGEGAVAYEEGAVAYEWQSADPESFWAIGMLRSLIEAWHPRLRVTKKEALEAYDKTNAHDVYWDDEQFLCWLRAIGVD
ncbi:MAG: hypothetical protein FJY81_03615, partial [Candidatus Aminicenantes bacterium]|nr:hypothetical protein [Candidatus Aminicenantes bacterium]